MALLEYKCPCCAGKLEFDSSLGKVKCPFCDTEFEMSTFTQLDEELKEEAKEDLTWNNESQDIWSETEEGMKAYQCQSCGAQIVTADTTAASKCPYCDNPIVMMGNLKGDLKPDFIIPFKYDKKAAKEAFSKHLTGKKLLPKVFKNQTHIDDISGVYVPHWVYDSKARATIIYKGEKVKNFTEGDFDVTVTEYYSVFRGGTMEYENVPVDGSKKMEDDLMDSVQPFDFSEAKPFQTAYMAGYLADKYDVTSKDCEPRANLRIRNSTESAFRATVSGYSKLDTESSRIALNNGTAKYGLLPLWIMNTTWNGQKYIFAMNGQTGKFVGDLPFDKDLLKTYRIKTGVIVAAAIYAASFLIKLIF